MSSSTPLSEDDQKKLILQLQSSIETLKKSKELRSANKYRKRKELDNQMKTIISRQNRMIRNIENLDKNKHRFLSKEVISRFVATEDVISENNNENDGDSYKDEGNDENKEYSVQFSQENHGRERENVGMDLNNTKEEAKIEQMDREKKDMCHNMLRQDRNDDEKKWKIVREDPNYDEEIGNVLAQDQCYDNIERKIAQNDDENEINVKHDLTNGKQKGGILRQELNNDGEKSEFDQNDRKNNKERKKIVRLDENSKLCQDRNNLEKGEMMRQNQERHQSNFLNQNTHSMQSSSEFRASLEIRRRSSDFRRQSTISRDKSEVSHCAFEIAATDTLLENQMFNTKTIHMNAVVFAHEYVIYPSWKNWALSWITALSSLFTISMQVFITFPLFLNISESTCAVHSDCISGSFCNTLETFGWKQPRCNACTIFEWDEECSLDVREEIWGATFEDHNKILWFEEDFTPNINFELNSNEIGLFSRCSAKEYCESTKLYGMENSFCPAIRLFLSKRTFEETMCFLFVCLLFATSICGDLKESDVEDKLLDFVLEEASGNDPGNRTLFSAYVIRICNRVRKYYLPLVTAIATVTVMLSEEFSSKNILLNLVAILFLLETDNKLGTLFLSSQFKKGDILVKTFILTREESVPSWGSKFYGMFISMIMLFAILNTQMLTTMLVPYSIGCSGIDDGLLYFAYIFGNVTTIVQPLITCILDKSGHRLAIFFLHFTRMNAALYLWGLICSITLSSLNFDASTTLPPLPMIVSIIASSIAGIRPSLILMHDIKRSLKNYFIDFAVVVCWILTETWILRRIALLNFV